jgi:3-oxoacyl-[acyl-carrier protein] reductase
MPNLLDGKHAVVFGAAVAKEFAAEGAELFLAGRTKAVIDALDDAAVNAYSDRIAKEMGSIVAVFNAVSPLATDYANGQHAVNLTIEQFMLPMATVLSSQFIFACAAARHMVRQHSGVIIFLTGSPARGHVEGATAIGEVFGAVETLCENLAVEVGPAGRPRLRSR